MTCWMNTEAKRGSPDQKRRAAEERSRIEKQAERIARQHEMERTRAMDAEKRGAAVTGQDRPARKKRAHETVWRGKWDRRMARWDARSRRTGKEGPSTPEGRP